LRGNNVVAGNFNKSGLCIDCWGSSFHVGYLGISSARKILSQS
jgi:hypothetical protein